MSTVRGGLLVPAIVAAVIAGCGGDGSQAVTCGGKPCARDAGPDGRRDAGEAPADGGPAAACGTLQACGGDVVGDWTFVEECESAADVAKIESDFAANIEPTWCAIARLVGIEPEASGSFQLDAAGNYSLDLMFGGSFDITYPQSCLVAFNCDDLTIELQAEIDARTFPLPSASSISCSGSSSCLCRATVFSAQSQSGTYTVSGGVLTFTATTGAVFDKSFCVQGDTLHILATSTGSSGQTSVDSDVVAVRQ
jgi:hypothetical protein